MRGSVAEVRSSLHEQIKAAKSEAKTAGDGARRGPQTPWKAGYINSLASSRHSSGGRTHGKRADRTFRPRKAGCGKSHAPLAHPDRARMTATRMQCPSAEESTTHRSAACWQVVWKASASVADRLAATSGSRAQHCGEIIFDGCSVCRARASALQASAQPRRACLPPSGSGSRQGLWWLPR